MKETEATTLLSNQSEQGVAALQFTEDKQYTTFRAEHAFDGDDIVFHFYRTEERPSDKYWSDTFPEGLSEIAQTVFKAGFPRLKAAFTKETDSWWMRAGGFAVEGLPEERIARFYKELDQALETRKDRAPAD
jgi:hypothetical protein